MSFALFTPVEAFEAGHAFTWFSAAEDTASLAAEARSDGSLRLWQAALAYVTNWPPSFVDPSKSGATPAENPRELTVSEGLKVFIAFLDAYNRLSVTETVLFTSYVDGDPAAWPEWLLALENSY
ncbi:hypothetical protein [Leifsonia poae]|uniref:Uncharacterized protein n=1 Tax=Leifsonia poae TaxID=110933 RepID=A0A9W6M0P4_9MICO|nr:hypothetical protein [Leifsonia poae]GLJ77608.1 hypothetical protein GCM10017584_31820 [Leifsonia poae]